MSILQNIDLLEKKANINESKVVYAHGKYDTSTCLNCQQQYDVTWMTDQLLGEHAHVGEIPLCEKCGGIVKPDIHLLSEDFPMHVLDQARQDLAECDLLIIMGTSLTIQPFCYLVDQVTMTTPRLLINDCAVGQRSKLKLCGLDYDSEHNYRDVFHCNTCDDGCYQLAQHLGLIDKFQALLSSEYKTRKYHEHKEGLVLQSASDYINIQAKL